MAAIAIGMLLGICSLLQMPRLPSVAALAALLGALLAVSAVLRSRMLAAAAFGVLACWLESNGRLADRLDPQLEGKTLELRGTVASVPQRRGDAVRFRLQVSEPRAAGIPSLLELSWYEPPWEPRAAEHIRVEVRLRRPRGFMNPGGSDLEARMLRERIGATGYVRTAERAGRGRREVGRYPVLAARAAVYDAIRDTLGERDATGIAAGLSVGLQDALSQDQWQALSRSGTSHLMAISGLHITMVAAIAAWLGGQLRRLRLRQGARGCVRDSAVAWGIMAGLGYSLLAGWSVPTQRTLLMIAVAALAVRARRRANAIDVLSLACVLILLVDPLAPLAIGFWLSFGAVAVILVTTDGFLRRAGIVREFTRVQVAVTLGLVPVLAAGFGTISIVSVLVNYVAVPLYTLLVVPGVLVATTFVLTAPVVGGPLLVAVAQLIESTWWVIAIPAAWPFATWGVGSLSGAAWAGLVAGTVLAVLPLPGAARVAGMTLMLAACLWRPVPPPEGGMHFALLDVGQGLAAVVQTHRHVLVFDAGPAFRSGRDAGALAIVPYLRQRGLRRIDLLAVSHEDQDHAGGARSLQDNLEVERTVRNGRGAGWPAAAPCRRGEHWTWDGVEFTWLHPGPRRYDSDNDASCVLRIVAPGASVLLTGDIESDAEAELLEAGALSTTDIVVMPHHGSRSSSTHDFVNALSPRWALCPAGWRNRWGFPDRAVVARWKASGAQVLETASTGAIEFEIQPSPALAAPRLHRSASLRFWHSG